MNYVVVRWATAVREAAKEKVVDETLWHRLKAYGGGVLLLHERPAMVSAVPELIRGLRERGYDIVPLTYFFSDEVRDFLWDAYDCQLENRPPLLSHTCLLLHNPSAPLPRNTEVQRILISLPPLVRQPTTQKKEVPAMTSSSLYESKFPPGTDPSPSIATWVWVAGALLCLLGITIGFLFWRARQSTLQRKIV